MWTIVIIEIFTYYPINIIGNCKRDQKHKITVTEGQFGYRSGSETREVILASRIILENIPEKNKGGVALNNENVRIEWKNKILI